MNTTTATATASPLQMIEFHSNHLKGHGIDNWPIKALTCATFWCEAECSVCKTKTTERKAKHFSQEGVIMCNNKDCSNFGKPLCGDDKTPVLWNDALVDPEENLKLGAYHNFQKLANVKYLCPKSPSHTLDFTNQYHMYCRDCDEVMTYCSDTDACKKVFSLGTLRDYSGVVPVMHEHCPECVVKKIAEKNEKKALSKKRKVEEEENAASKRQATDSSSSDEGYYENTYGYFF